MRLLASAMFAMLAWAQPAQAECLAGAYAGTAGEAGQEPFPVLVTIECVEGAVRGRIESVFGTVLIGGGQTTSDSWRVEAVFDSQPLALEAVRDGDGWNGSYQLGPSTGVLALRRDDDASFAALSADEQERLDLSPAEWRADLAALAREIPARHGNAFHRIDRAMWDAAVAELGARLPTLGVGGAPVAMRELVARIGDGHTAVRLPTTRRLPIGMFWFGDEMRIVVAPPDRRELLGARIVGFGDRTIEEAAELAGRLDADENRWGELGATPFLLRREDVLRYYGMVREGEDARLRVGFANGGEQDVHIGFESAPASSPAFVASEAPIWRRRPDEALWWERQPDGLFYVNFRGYDQLRTRSAALLAELDRLRPAKVVLDMRDNSGGDFTLFRETLLEAIRARSWLDRRDRLFVIVGREMFSAAMTNAADLKLLTNATLVGEPIGERPNSWQEVRSFALPNSRLRVGVSTAYYEALPGAGDPDAVTPHVDVPPTWAAFSAGRDDALEWIRAN